MKEVFRLTVLSPYTKGTVIGYDENLRGGSYDKYYCVCVHWDTQITYNTAAQNTDFISRNCRHLTMYECEQLCEEKKTLAVWSGSIEKCGIDNKEKFKKRRVK